ncbi:MAG: FtsX-like permease family protein [Candidatus Hermodarchaeota archaeon]
MSLGRFTISGFKYEKVRIFFLIVTLIISTSAAMVAFAMERALAGQVNFSNLFISPLARFSWFIIILTFLAVITFCWLVIDALLKFRSNDLAVMVSLGGVRAQMHAYFLAELTLIFFLGLVGGLFLGLLLTFFYYFSLSLLGFTVNAVVAFPLVIILIVLVLVGSYFLASIHLSLRTRKYYTQIAGEERVITHSVLNRLSNKYFSFKFALLTLSRRSMKIQYLSFFFVGFILVTLAVGGSIIKNTNIYYMERAIGTDTYLLGHSDVTSLVKQNLAFTGEPLAPSINLTDSKYHMNPNLLSNLSRIVSSLDARFLLYTDVQELPAIIIEEGQLISAYYYSNTSAFEPPEYGDLFTVIGSNRSSQSYVFGLTNPIFNYFIEDGTFTINNTHIVIGNLVWYALFDEPFLERLQISSPVFPKRQKDFRISGIIQDPFAAGMTCYIGLDLLLESFLQTFNEVYNLVFVQVDPSDEAALYDFTAAHGLSIEPLEPIKEANRAAQNFLWLINLFSGIPLSLAMIGGIVSVLIANAEEQRTDLHIIRALGGRKRQLLQFTITKTSLMVLTPWIPALLVGWFFSSTALISNSTPPDIWVGVWIGLNILLSLFVAVIGISIQSSRIYRNPVFSSVL